MICICRIFFFLQAPPLRPSGPPPPTLVLSLLILTAAPSLQVMMTAKLSWPSSFLLLSTKITSRCFPSLPLCQATPKLLPRRRTQYQLEISFSGFRITFFFMVSGGRILVGHCYKISPPPHPHPISVCAGNTTWMCLYTFPSKGSQDHFHYAPDKFTKFPINISLIG